MRLDKLLSRLGVCSRSECRNLLKAGRVAVHGVIAKNPAMDVMADGEILVDGKRLDIRLCRHVMLYKPSGVLTAREDSRCRTVMDLLPGVYTALECMPVGRLDKDTTGILLLTTDGELAHRLISPARHVDKIYLATVDGELTKEDVKAFQAGIALQDFTALPAKLEILQKNVGRVTVQEGKYHQIKRMFASVGKPVLALHRSSFGALKLDAGMNPGDYRELNSDEIAALYAAAGLKNE